MYVHMAHMYIVQPAPGIKKNQGMWGVLKAKKEGKAKMGAQNKNPGKFGEYSISIFGYKIISKQRI